MVCRQKNGKMGSDNTEKFWAHTSVASRVFFFFFAVCKRNANSHECLIFGKLESDIYTSDMVLPQPKRSRGYF